MGVGQAERGTRGRSCGEIEGTGVEAILAFLSFSFPFLSFLSFPVLSFLFLFLPSLSFHAPDLAFELLDTRKYAPRDAVKTETRRQKRRTSKYRKRRNRGDEEKIWARSSENVNSRAIAVRLHAQMNYNNNNNNRGFKCLLVI